MGEHKKKEKLKRAARKILFAAAVIYLVCLIFSMISVFHMQELSYNAWGWGVILAEYKLDFADDFLERNYYDFDGTLMTHVENSFTTAQQLKVRFICSFSLMPLWRGTYINPSVADGDQWELISINGKEERRVYGSNAYPLTYRFVYSTIRSVCDTV